VVVIIPLGESLFNNTILVGREAIFESFYHTLDVENKAV